MERRGSGVKARGGATEWGERTREKEWMSDGEKRERQREWEQGWE